VPPASRAGGTQPAALCTCREAQLPTPARAATTRAPRPRPPARVAPRAQAGPAHPPPAARPAARPASTASRIAWVTCSGRTGA